MKYKDYDMFRLEDRVLFEAAAAVEIVEAAEAAQDNPNANVSETDRQAQDSKDALKNAPPDKPAEQAVQEQGKSQEDPSEVADVDAQVEELIQGEIPATEADAEADADIPELGPADDSGIPQDGGAEELVDVVIQEKDVEISTGKELVVIDYTVPKLNAILADLKPNQEAVILGNGSGLDQLNEYLDAQGEKYDTIHFLTHGKAGSLSLNGEKITADNFNFADWQAVGEHLTADGDLLLYGCDTADGSEGRLLVDKIAEASGADVAASTDTTGFNGNWELEYSTGRIEAQTLSVDGYAGNLPGETTPPTTITVDTLNDIVDPDDGYTSLREAFEQINRQSGVYNIRFSVSGTISLGSTLSLSAAPVSEGQNPLTTVFIYGDNDNNGVIDITLNGGNTHQIFNLNSCNVNVDSVTFRNGSTDANGGAIYNYGGNLYLAKCNFTDNKALNGIGGAVYSTVNTIANYCIFSNNEALRGGAIGGGAVITDSTFSNNTAAEEGGAIYSEYTTIMTVSGSTFTGNKATDGGAIYRGGSPDGSDTEISITNSTFTRNSATGSGGAVHNEGVITIDQATFTGNTAGAGGAIGNNNDLIVSNALFNENTSETNGGAVDNNAGLIMLNSTFTGNAAAGSGNAIYSSASGDLLLANSILTGNLKEGADFSAGGDLFAEAESKAEVHYSLFGENSTNLSLNDTNFTGHRPEDILNANGTLRTDLFNYAAAGGVLIGRTGHTVYYSQDGRTWFSFDGTAAGEAPKNIYRIDRRGTTRGDTLEGDTGDLYYSIGAYQAEQATPEDPSTWVTMAEDVVNPYDNRISLREALEIYGKTNDPRLNKVHFTEGFDNLTLTQDEPISVTEKLTLVNGFTINGTAADEAIFDVKSGGSLTFESVTLNTGMLTGMGEYIFTGAVAGTAVAGGANVTYNGGSQTLYTGQYGNLTLSSNSVNSVKTIQGDTTVTGTFSAKGASPSVPLNVTGDGIQNIHATGRLDLENVILGNLDFTSPQEIRSNSVLAYNTVSGLTITLTLTPGTTTITYGETLAGKQVNATGTTVLGQTVLDLAFADTETLLNASDTPYQQALLYTVREAFSSGYRIEPAYSNVKVNRRTITVSGIGANDRVYNGSDDTSVTLNYDNVIFTGIIGDDILEVTASGKFDDGNAGTNKHVTLSNLTLGGKDAGNYVLAASGQQQSASGSITPKGITVIAKDAQKEFGTPDPVFQYTAAGLIGGDRLTGKLGREPGENAGRYELNEGSLGNSNYFIENFESAYLTITPKAIVVDPDDPNLDIKYDVDKVYDGTIELDADSSLRITIDGQTIQLKWDDAEFNDQNVKKVETVTFYDVTGTSKDGNYVIAMNRLRLDAKGAITPRDLTISGITANDRSYNGKNDLSVTLTYLGIKYENRIEGDEVWLNTDLVQGQFADGNAGIHDVYISNLILTGADVDVSNYTLTNTTLTVQAEITPKVISATVAYIDSEKEYDGNTSVQEHNCSIDKLIIKGDDVRLLDEFAYDSADAGARQISATQWELAGADADNYILQSFTPIAGTIVPRAITVTATNTGKVYGEADPRLEWQITGGSLVDGENLNGSLARDPGEDVNRYIINAGTLTRQNNPNYAITFVRGVFTITAKEIAVDPNAENFYYKITSQVYDGGTHVDKAEIYIKLDEETFIVFGWEEAYFNSKNVDEVSTATFTGLNSTNKNYQLDTSTLTLDAAEKITQREITVSGVTADDRTYNGVGDTSATLDYSDLKFHNAVAGDDLSITADGKFADGSAGIDKTVTITNIVLGGDDARNYILKTDTLLATATINQKTITITANSDSRKYDGTALTNSGYSVTDDLVGGDALDTVTITGTITDYVEGGVANVVGEVTIRNSEGADVTGNYNIVRVDGKLMIEKRVVQVTAGSGSKEYDGTALTNPAWSLTGGDGFVGSEGFSSVTVTGSQTTVGTSANTITGYEFLPGTNADNYTIELVAGTLTVTASGDQLVITTGSASKTYDGTALTHGEWSVTGLQSGDRIVVTVNGSQTNAGQSENTVASYTIYNSADENVTDNYGNIAIVTGTLTVTRREVTITVDSAQKVYDGTALTLEDDAYQISGSFADGEGMDTVTIDGSQTFVGSSDSTLAYTLNDRTNADNYTITVVSGRLTVTKASIAITVTADSAQKMYDGTLLTESGYTWTETLASGDRVVATTTGGRLHAGEGVNTFSDVRIMHGDVDVTENYVITREDGTLTVTRRQVTITADSAEKEYDGTALTDSGYTISGDGFINGEGLQSVTISGSQTNAGQSVNDAVSFRLTTGTRSGDYDIRLVDGTLTVGKRIITVSGVGADDRVYSGRNDTSVTLDYDNVEFDRLINGDVLNITATGSFRDGNAGENKTVTLNGFTLSGEDAGNYELNIEGSQKETQATIRRKVVTGVVDIREEKVYDGNNSVTIESQLLNGLVAGDEGDVSLNASFVYDSANAGDRIISSDVWELTGDAAGNYQLLAYHSINGRITPKQVEVFWEHDASYTYDGTDQSDTVKACYLGVDGSRNYVDYYFRNDAQFINAGRYSAVVDGQRTPDGNYRFSGSSLSLTINQREIVVTADSASFLYDGQEHSVSGVTADNLADGHSVSTTVSVSATDAGSYDYVPGTGDVKITDGNNADVTANYKIVTLNQGVLTINRHTISIAADSLTVTYDGSGHTLNGVTADWLADGHTISTDSSVSRTDAGSTVYEVDISDVVIKDAGGNIVTGNYSFDKVASGTLLVNRRQITITADSDTIVYDGREHTLNGVTADNLVSGHVISTDVSVSGLDAGEYIYDVPADSITITVNGREVTGNYEFSAVTSGKLVITAAGGLAIDVKDTSKVYDGTALTAEEADFTVAGLLQEDHHVVLTVEGEITNVGAPVAIQVLGYRILDGEGHDVTSSYGQAVITAGSLSIEKADVSVAIHAEKEYDGSAGQAASQLTVTVSSDESGTLSNDSFRVDSLLYGGSDAGDYTEADGMTGNTSLTTGFLASNYNITYTYTGKITPKSVTVAWEQAPAYTYNGQDQSDTVKAYYTDVNGERVYIDYGFAGGSEFINAGSYTAEVSGSVSLDGNYRYADSALNLEIAKANVSIAVHGVREYDGTSGRGDSSIAVTVRADESGTLSSDSFRVDSLLYGDSDAGDYTEANGMTGSTSLTAGFLASNYNITYAYTGKITPRTVAIAWEHNDSYRYDGHDQSGTVKAYYTDVNGNRVYVDYGFADGRQFINAGDYSAEVSGAVSRDGNYRYEDAAQHLTIDRRSIVITANSADKVYDGTALTDSGYRLSGDGFAAGEGLSSVSVFGTQTNAGESANALAGYTLQNNTWGGNYEIKTVDGTLTVARRTIVISGITAEDRDYNGAADTSATLNYDHVNWVGQLVNGDQVSISATGSFADGNAGVDKEVTLGGLVLSGADAGNYVLAATGQQTTTTATIRPKEITVSGITAEDRIYNGVSDTSVTLNYDGVRLDGMIAGDDLSVKADGSFADGNAGEDKTVTLDLTLTGNGSGNYVLATERQTTTATIARKGIVIMADSQTKVYGENDPDLTYQVSGLVGGDGNEIFTGTLDRTDGENVGSYNITQGSLAANSNYEITFVQATFTITAQVIHVDPDSDDFIYTLDSKVYDGNRQVGGASISIIAKDGSMIELTWTEALFDSKDVLGVTEAVFSGLASSNKNYVLDCSEITLDASGKITAKEITISGIAADDRVYNGVSDTSVTLNYDGVQYDGLIAGDELSVTANGAFSDGNAGVDKTVTLGGLAFSGADAGNYVLAATGQQTTASASIARRVITVSGIGADDRVYNGVSDTSVTLNYGGVKLDGLLAGDNLTVSAAGSFADGNAGADKTVTLDGLTLGGEHAHNYILAAAGHQESTTATITRREITVSGIGANDRVYTGFGDSSVKLDYSQAYLNGLIAGDDLAVSADGRFYDGHAGQNKTVALDNFALSGADAGNYILAATGHQKTATATIHKAQVIVTADDQFDVEYGTVVSPDFSGVLMDGDRFTGELAITGGKSGAGFWVAGIHEITRGTLDIEDGNGGQNYEIVFIGDTFNVTPKVLVANPDIATDKVYDGTTSVQYNGSSFTGLLDGDSVTLDAAFEYNSANVIEADSIAAAQWEISGEDAGNYRLVDFAPVSGTITAKTVDAVWNSDAPYYFNGRDQGDTITAFYADINGERVQLEVAFGGTGSIFRNPGDYTASVASSDPNYVISTETATHPFTIQLAGNAFNDDQFSQGLNPNYSTTVPAIQGALLARGGFGGLYAASYAELVAWQEQRHFQPAEFTSQREAVKAYPPGDALFTLDNPVRELSVSLTSGTSVDAPDALATGLELSLELPLDNHHSEWRLLDQSVKLPRSFFIDDVPADELPDPAYDLRGIRAELPRRADAFKSELDLLLEELVGA